AVWGGGGTRAMIRQVLPNAHFYSARSGEPVKSSNASDAPDVVIWAVPRSRMQDSRWPEAAWRPRFVVDLNYTMDSPGREYAAKIPEVHYKSGLQMFKVQAEEQRCFWDS